MTLRSRCGLLFTLLLSVAAHAGVGSLDPAFGTAGSVTFAGDSATAALAPDSRIVVAIRDTADTSGHVRVLRLETNGSSDNAFGTAGLASIPPCSGCRIYRPEAVVVQPDGRILVAATEGLQAVALYPAQGLVARLNADGTPDATFGTGGRKVLQFGNDTRVETIALQPDGRIVVGGSTGPLTTPGEASQQRRMVARLDGSGNVDASFDGDGVAIGDFGRVQHLHVRTDGRIDALGTSTDGPALSRFASNGTLELAVLLAPGIPTFAPVDGVAWEADGRFWISIYSVVTLRTPDGAVDPGFPARQFSYSQQFAPLGDGSVLAFGDRAVRLLADGSIDPNFGNFGELRSLAQYRPDQLVVQPDGKVLAAGGSSIARIDPFTTGFVGTQVIEFPYQSLGTLSEELPVTVTNTTGAATSITVTTPKHYEHLHDCGGSLAAGASCTVMLFHRPVPPFLSYYDQTTGYVTIAGSGGTPTASLFVTGRVEGGLVYHFYRSILRREPDVSGADYWIGRALNLAAVIGQMEGAYFASQTSHPWYALAMTFFGNAEYASFNAGEDAYISDLYRTFFDRDPDAAGIAYWKSQLAQGLTREGLLLQFMFSAEFVSFTDTNFNEDETRPEIETVLDFYRGLLHRLPDDVGFSTWTIRFQRAQCAGASGVYDEVEVMSKLFLESPEYLAFTRDNAGYVVDLYNAFLGRAPDVAGLQYWKGLLDAGSMSRDTMRQAFVSSPEFSARVQAIISTPCRAT
jgi:uncharacterized delta-60 repeat protein